jgi:hypothetical protein
MLVIRADAACKPRWYTSNDASNQWSAETKDDKEATVSILTGSRKYFDILNGQTREVGFPAHLAESTKTKPQKSIHGSISLRGVPRLLDSFIYGILMLCSLQSSFSVGFTFIVEDLDLFGSPFSFCLECFSCLSFLRSLFISFLLLLFAVDRVFILRFCFLLLLELLSFFL